MSGSYLLFYLGTKHCGTINTSIWDMKVSQHWGRESKTGTDRLLFTQIWPAAVTCTDPDKPTSHCSLNSSMPGPLVISPERKIWNDHCQSSSGSSETVAVVLRQIWKGGEKKHATTRESPALQVSKVLSSVFWYTMRQWLLTLQGSVEKSEGLRGNYSRNC